MAHTAPKSNVTDLAPPAEAPPTDDIDTLPVQASEVKSVAPKSSSTWSGTQLTLSALGGAALIGGALALGGGSSKSGSAPSSTPNTSSTSSSSRSENDIASSSYTDKEKITPLITDTVSHTTDVTTLPSEVENNLTKTTLYFPNGQTTVHQGDSPLDLTQLQYKVVSASLAQQEYEDTVIYLDKNHPAFARLLKEAKEIINQSPSEAQKRLEEAFKVDSDGDGVIDILDKAPTMWNVSERDLRSFSVLAYENGTDLRTAFAGSGRPSALHSYKDGQYKVGKVDAQNMDLDALTKHWDLIEFGNPGNDLQYAIFGNGKNGTRNYKNIVVAFRGTEASSLSDINDDLKIYDGRVPSQARYLESIARKIESYAPDNIYSTGHSLGGYLAQYFAAHTMQSRPEWKSDFTHSALFNPVPLPNESHTTTARKLSDQFTQTAVAGEKFNKTNSYVIKGEFVSDGALLAGTGIAVAETAKGAAKGSFLGALGGLALALLTSGASLAAGLVAGATAGAAAGTVVGAANGIQNGAKAVQGLGTYDNTTLFDFKQGDLWGKHDLASFFERDGKLKIHFTNGYRMDNHYLNDDRDYDGLTDYQEARIGTSVSLKDTDGDGIDDVIEVKVGANPLAKNETPWAVVSSEDYFDDTPLMIFAEITQGEETALKGIVLSPTQTGDGVLYQATEVVDIQEALNPALLIDTEHLTDNAFSTLNGNAQDDIFTLGEINAVINSGEGKDRFVFHQINEGKISYLNDFDLANDKLVFAREFFSDLKGFTYSQSQGQVFYQDTHFITLEQGLALNSSHIEFI